MEKFKAVEKEMKTKQYSKEGLSAATKLDPKEKEKMDVADFLGEMVEQLSQQIEAAEAEMDTLQAGLKKKKGDSGKSDRVSELERTVERHKWHTGKLEILLRALENGSVETDQVKDLEDSIKYYVEQNQELDFVEDEELYEDLNLDAEEDAYGFNNEMDKVSSQDAQSVQDEPSDEPPSRSTSIPGAKNKSQSTSENASGRRPSVQLKSPLPALSTLHSSLPNNTTTKQVETMKPAPLPSIPTGQPLKYASAAAAAAASDKNGVGIAPLPPPPGAAKTSQTSSPAASIAQPASAASPAQEPAPQPAKPVEPPKQPSPAPKEEPRTTASEPAVPQPSKTPSQPAEPQPAQQQPQPTTSKAPQPPSPDSGIAGIALSHGEPAPEEEEQEEESIYHLPSSLADLLDSFEETKSRSKTTNNTDPFDPALLAQSRLTCPTPSDAERPMHYKPLFPYANTPSHYPQEPLGIFDDPRLYSRIDTDSLFYGFYYRQGTYQQYLAAKALKSQSWRFHKQYQTWFQRHEEPKTITEEFEQGTYRFFDYESTW